MERKFAFEKVDNLFMEEGISVWESEVGKKAYVSPCSFNVVLNLC